MKNIKKYITGIAILIFILICGYLYTYKDQRNINEESEVYNGKVENLFSSYKENEIDSNIKYLDKAIIVSGKVSSLETETKSLELENQLHGIFLENLPDSLEIGKEVLIKGRLIGYDSLINQLKMDQCVIINH